MAKVSPRCVEMTGDFVGEMYIFPCRRGMERCEAECSAGHSTDISEILMSDDWLPFEENLPVSPHIKVIVQGDALAVFSLFRDFQDSPKRSRGRRCGQPSLRREQVAAIKRRLAQGEEPTVLA